MDLCDLHFNYNRKNYKVSVLNEIGAMVFNNINKIREKIKVGRRVSKNAIKRGASGFKGDKIERHALKWRKFMIKTPVELIY